MFSPCSAKIRADEDLPVQAKLFTQNFQAATSTQQSPQPTIKQPSPNSTRPSLFKKTFSPIFKGDENAGQDVKRANDVSKSLPASRCEIFGFCLLSFCQNESFLSFLTLYTF